MSEVIELPSGGTVTLMAADDLRGRHREKVAVAVLEARNVTNEADNIVAVACLADQMIVAWSIPYLPDAKIPSEDPAISVGDLRPQDWAAVTRAASPAMAILYPPPVTPDDSDKPGSPTSPDAA